MLEIKRFFFKFIICKLLLKTSKYLVFVVALILLKLIQYWQMLVFGSTIA